MGKKNRKSGASSSAPKDESIPKSVKKECAELINTILEKCAVPFGSKNQEWADYVEVYDLVEQLRTKQAGYSLPHCSREEEFPKFVEWLKKADVDTSKIEIHQFSNEGHGLRAQVDLQESELFLSVPRKLMMTTETAMNTSLGDLAKQDRMLSSMANVLLALHILFEKARVHSSMVDSQWAPYIKIMPDTYNTPLYFTKDEMQLLKGSPVFSEAIALYRNITRQYAYFFKVLQNYPDKHKIPIKEFCYDDYRWAVSTVMTRQNLIPSTSGGPKVLALIPVWDMCNHAWGQYSTDYNDEKSSCECYAQRAFETGDQITIHYGNRTNAEFLLHNGFVPTRNPYDSLAVKLGISKNDPLHAQKTEVLSKLALPSYCLRGGQEPVDSDLIAFTRVFVMDEECLQARLKGDNAKKLRNHLRLADIIVNTDNEIKVWQFLLTRCQLLLKCYPTSISDDDRLLEKPEGELSENYRLAVRLRREEKQILAETIAYIEKYQLEIQIQFQEEKMERIANEKADLVAQQAADKDELAQEFNQIKFA